MKKIYKDEELPCYEIVIDDYDNTGIKFVSIVGDPAIEVMGMAFSAVGIKEFEFKEDKDKQIIVGPAMIPNRKIKRKNDDGSFYMVVFTKETILQMVSKFNSSGSNRRINLDHTKEMVQAYVMENWIVEDPYYDKSRMYGFDVPVGTWMISVKVEDEAFWKEEVRANGKYGFSIEGMMGQKPSSMSIEKVIDDMSEDELIQLFADVTEDSVLTFMKSKGNRLGSKQSFVDIDEVNIGDTQWVWAYSGPLDEKTRPFCKHMLELDKYWTQDDLDELSIQLGYDFEQYFGSYNCRHTLKRYGIQGEPDQPTDSDKDKLIQIQDQSGLVQ
jgi:hypothetical protein